MKTSKILFLLASMLILASCSNDDEPVNVLDTAKVTEVGSFTDEDGREYKCVQIGNQVWMAENLAYYVTGGQLSGCYTWKEADMDMEELESLLGKTVELTEETWFNLYDEMFWDGFIGSGSLDPNEEDILYDYYYELETWMMDYGMITIEEANGYLQENCPKFYADMQDRIAKMNKSDEEIIAEETKAHSDAAERGNGNYSLENGYLYTLDGAKAAVAHLEEKGWRLPSDADWKKLEETLGMSKYDQELMNAWRGSNTGEHLKFGGAAKFNAVYTGCNAWANNKGAGGYYINRDYSAYYWASDETSTTVTEEGEDEEGNATEETFVLREGIVRQVSIYQSKIWRGITRLDGVCYSVRCVIDVNDFNNLDINTDTEEEAGN